MVQPFRSKVTVLPSGTIASADRSKLPVSFTEPPALSALTKPAELLTSVISPSAETVGIIPRIMVSARIMAKSFFVYAFIKTPPSLVSCRVLLIITGICGPVTGLRRAKHIVFPTKFLVQRDLGRRRKENRIRNGSCILFCHIHPPSCSSNRRCVNFPFLSSHYNIDKSPISRTNFAKNGFFLYICVIPLIFLCKIGSDIDFPV